MKKVRRPKRPARMRAEYEFAGGVRGKYAARFAKGSNVVLLDPEVAAAFPDSKSVNDALRRLAKSHPTSGRGRPQRG